MSSIVYIGRHSQTIDGTGTLGDDVMKVSVYNKTTQHLWLRRIGGTRGISDGTSSIQYRYVAYLGTSAHEPDTRLGYVGLKTTTASMSFAGDGSDIDHAIEVVDNGPDQAAQVWSGSYVALGIEQDTPGTLMFGMKVASGLTADEKRIFTKTGVGVPPDPIGSFTTATAGHMAMYAVCDTNDKPNVPVNRSVDTSVYPGATELTPYFNDNFRDNNGSWGGANGYFDDGDTITYTYHQLRRVSDGVMFWNDSRGATPENTAAGNENGNALYTGTTLVRGTAYEWRVQHADRFGAKSDWSSWLTYTPPSTGSVTINSGHTPTGKQEAVNSYTFQFIWNHSGGLSTNAVKVRITDAKTGAIVQENGLWKTNTTANGATGTITFAATLFADLDWGKSYTVAIKGRATDNNESNYSNEHAFNTNAAPTVPSSLRPTGGLTYIALPLLQAKWSDADDTTGTGLTGTFELTRPDGSTVLVTPTFNVTSGYWEFQTTATHITMVGTYSFRGRSFDGTLYSGASTITSGAAWSSSASFIYATSGATLTITAPTSDSSILTSTPAVTWTSDTQAQYRVQVMPTGSSQAVYDSSWVVNGVTRTINVPSGILAPGRTYDFYVSVKDGAAVETDAAVYNVTLSYIAPADVVGFSASPVAVYTDPEPTAVRFEWQASSEANFVAYLIYRNDIADRPLMRLESIAQTAALDLLPLSGVEHTYTIKVVTLNSSGFEISSAGVTAVAEVDFRSYVLVSVLNPMTNRVILTSVQAHSHSHVGNEVYYQPWGALTTERAAPTTIRGKSRYRTETISAFLFDDAAATGMQRHDELAMLADSGETFSLRDDMRNKFFYVFPAEDGVSVTRLRLGLYQVDLILREEAFTEGIITS